LYNLKAPCRRTKNSYMEDKMMYGADVLPGSNKFNNNYQQQSRHFSATHAPIEYADSNLNQQELEDYHDSLLSMMEHSDSTSIGSNGIISSNPRPDAGRVLDASLMEFDLNLEMENIKLEENWVAGNQSAKTLVKNEYMRMVFIAMHKGNEMKMHQAKGPISLQVFEGDIQFTTWDSAVTIKAGQFVALRKGIPNSLVAKEKSILLLTLLNLDDDPEKPSKDRDIEERALEETEIEKEEPEEIGSEEEEILENSENINFPDFPTYPPEDDVYKAPDEIQSPG
jgi:quercetin dioxygenase-like cupin family protein